MVIHKILLVIQGEEVRCVGIVEQPRLQVLVEPRFLIVLERVGRLNGLSLGNRLHVVGPHGPIHSRKCLAGVLMLHLLFGNLLHLSGDLSSRNGLLVQEAFLRLAEVANLPLLGVLRDHPDTVKFAAALLLETAQGGAGFLCRVELDEGKVAPREVSHILDSGKGLKGRKNQCLRGSRSEAFDEKSHADLVSVSVSFSTAAATELTRPVVVPQCKLEAIYF
mmetsp:Transcript_28009/g.44918  ORF Transcript_28009/g.44918 Transcript_28009/m.44918 type:complete len:221 (+) Transcript_28009:174-836(+)